MADGVTVRVNIPDFKRQMSAFIADMERRVVRAATNAAAQEYKKAVIAKAPIGQGFSKRRVPGLLKKSIYVARSRSGSHQGQETYSVSFRKGRGRGKAASGIDAFYGTFLEAGWIPRGPGRRIRGGRRRKALQRKRLAAQKITKYRFIDPGFKAAGDRPLKAFNARIEKRIAIENAKRGR